MKGRTKHIPPSTLGYLKLFYDFRLMKHEHVAELLGIQNSNHPTPAFVFSGNLKPLGRFLKSRMVRIKDDVPRMLKEVLLGLEYIHKKKMVHMELNLNTVTVSIFNHFRLESPV